MYVYFALAYSKVTEIFEIDTEITNIGCFFMVRYLQYLYIYIQM
jgi:hypothetical protein